MVEDLGAQWICVREVELVGDDQGLGPCDLGGTGIVGGALGLTKISETGGFAVEIPASVEQVNGLPVGVDGLLVLTEMVVDVAETVPDVGLAVEIADLQS
jgi:hypothetical protein